MRCVTICKRMKTNGFPKREHLCSKLLIDQLFEPGKSKSLQAYPLRMVYREADSTQVLISVPKRLFHHAIDRNRIKRQVREAYRTNKHLLPASTPLSVAFLWLDNKHYPTSIINKKVCNLLIRGSENIASAQSQQ